MTQRTFVEATKAGSVVDGGAALARVRSTSGLTEAPTNLLPNTIRPSRYRKTSFAATATSIRLHPLLNPAGGVGRNGEPTSLHVWVRNILCARHLSNKLDGPTRSVQLPTRTVTPPPPPSPPIRACLVDCVRSLVAPKLGKIVQGRSSSPVVTPCSRHGRAISRAICGPD